LFQCVPQRLDNAGYCQFYWALGVLAGRARPSSKIDSKAPLFARYRMGYRPGSNNTPATVHGFYGTTSTISAQWPTGWHKWWKDDLDEQKTAGEVIG
jgi:hypothetical protein